MSTDLHIILFIILKRFHDFVNLQIFCLLISILFMTSTHQTTNFVYPDFLHKIFSVWAIEKDNKHFIGPKQIFFTQFWDEKFIYW